MRTSHRANLAVPALAELVRSHFDSAEIAGDSVATSYGAISRLAVRAHGRDLRVDVTMNPKVPGDVAAETIGRYNRFLQATTGFTAKERAKRLRKSAGEPSSGA